MLKVLYNECLFSDHLLQMLEITVWGVKSNCRLCFLNKVLLEHTHIIVYL